MIFGLTERAIKPENERFQLRTIPRNGLVNEKDYALECLARREKGVLRAAHIPILPLYVSAPPGFFIVPKFKKAPTVGVDIYTPPGGGGYSRCKAIRGCAALVGHFFEKNP